MKTATLSLLFEAQHLFVTVVSEDHQSFEDALALLNQRPSLSVDRNGIYLKNRDVVLKNLSSHYHDEFGCWLDGADRTSYDDYWAALIPLEKFVTLVPNDPGLRLVWWSIGEGDLDDDDKLVATTRQEEGYIDTPETDLALSVLGARTV